MSESKDGKGGLCQSVKDAVKGAGQNLRDALRADSGGKTANSEDLSCALAPPKQHGGSLQFRGSHH